MNTPSHPVTDSITLIRDLASGKVARVVLDCGQPHSFRPRDLLANQEALLLLAGIEQVLAKFVGAPVTSSDGSAHLEAELGLAPLRVPSLLGLLALADRRLNHKLLRELHALRLLRNKVLHGAAPIFVPENVVRIRKAYDRLVLRTGHQAEAPLAAAIARAQAAQREQDGRPVGPDCALLVDVLGIVDVEKTIRSHLSSQPALESKVDEAESAFDLLRLLKSRHITAKLHHELRLIFTLRNHVAHGLLLELNDGHRTLVRRVIGEFHGALAAARLSKSGGCQSVGEILFNGLCL